MRCELLGGVYLTLPRPVPHDRLRREPPRPVSGVPRDVVQEQRHDERERQDRDEQERQRSGRQEPQQTDYRGLDRQHERQM